MSDAPVTDEAKDPFLGAEMLDREQRRMLRKKQKEELKPSGDEIDVALAQGKLAEGRKARNKKIFRGGLAVAGGAFVIWVGMYLFAPYKAGVTYGVCRVFIENMVRYPQDLRFSGVEDFGDSVRVWYTQIDAFGEYRMENVQCHFKQDPERGAIVDKITINRRPIEQEKVDAFNRVLPIVFANLPDLTYPDSPATSLQDLQINTDLFRKQLYIRKR